MLQDRFRKKTKQPAGSSDASLVTADLTDQVPQIDDVLAEVDKAIKKAQLLEKKLCTCCC
ncbi:MAG: hypothetical protein HY340_02070 [Candidatus Kerfeldbacteria bacterium]|nr:hypothetical protein [Candidatus Kerfeldbacteria bacterium]